MPIILATWEAEIRRISVQDKPRQIVHKTHPPISKNNQSKWIGGVVQAVQCLFASVKP
jgi:hypothetical protein